jgi:hypothetical protein
VAASSARPSYAAAIDKAVFPGWQGGPLEHVIAGKAVAFHEALQPEFKQYAQQIVKNASALAEALVHQGFRLVSGGTDIHLMVVDLRPFDAELTGKEAQACSTWAASRSTRTPSPTTRAARSSPAACASARRRSPRRGCFATGLTDDVRTLSAPAKVAGLVLAGSVLSLSGLSLLFFRVPFFDLLVLSPDLSALLTVVWVVGMANAINLIDGLDGLAAGITAIAAAAFLAYSFALSRNGVLDPGNVGPLIAVIVLGVCLGFLPYNVHPARIIMGDGGALFLGAAMATATISVGGNSDDPFSGQAWSPCRRRATGRRAGALRRLAHRGETARPWCSAWPTASSTSS